MKYSKLILVGLIIILGLALTAFYLKDNIYFGKPSNKALADPDMVGVDDLHSADKNTSGIIAHSIKDSLKLSATKTIKCIRTSKDIKPGVVYVKNGMFYYEGGSQTLDTTAEASGIFKDDMAWVWVPGEKTGSIFNAPKNIDWESDVIKDFDQYSYDCGYSDSSDDIFTPPSDITFN